MEKNPCKLPRDMRFLIFQDFTLADLLMLCQVNKDCAKILHDENFWQRKLAREYPTVDENSYKYDSYLDLYKQITRGVGKLYYLDFRDDKPIITQDNVDYLVQGYIELGDDETANQYAIDAQGALRIVLNIKDPQNQLDRWLEEEIGESSDVVVTNVKSVLNSNNALYILTVNHNLYGIYDYFNGLPSEIQTNGGRTQESNLLAENVKEIGGVDVGYNHSIAYYILKTQELYVASTQVSKRKFELVGKVQTVALDVDELYYVTMDSKLCEFNKGKPRDLYQFYGEIVQCVVKRDNFYILYKDGTLSYFREETTDDVVIDEKFKRLYSDPTSDIILAQTFDRRLFRINDGKLLFVSNEVLHVVYGVIYIYLILMPTK